MSFDATSIPFYARMNAEAGGQMSDTPIVDAMVDRQVAEEFQYNSIDECLECERNQLLALARRLERDRARLLECVPTSWLDPMLSGRESVISVDDAGTWDCQDIERLLNAIRERMQSAIRAAEEPMP